MKRNHRHADKIRQWLDDDSLIVERQSGAGDWYEDPTCRWYEDSEYRFRPKMIRCGRLEIPEPLRVVPKFGTDYWTVGIDSREDNPVQIVYWVWEDDELDFANLKLGICHLTSSAAEAHSLALINLTKDKV